MPNIDFYKNLIEQISDGIYFVDRRRTITYWSRGAEDLTGYSQEEVLGHRCWHNILRHVDGQGRQLCRGWCPLVATLQDGCEREADVYLHHKEGHRVPVQVRTMAIRDDAGAIIGAAEIFNDRVDDTAGSVDRLQQEGLLDPLTQIGNRRYIEQHLRARLDELQRYRYPFGVLLMDINAFKQVNDTYGHQVGDKVLQMVANTLRRCVRPLDLVGRWGGDEFLIVAQNVDADTLATMTEQTTFLVQQSFLRLDQRIIKITTSAGTTLAESCDTLETLLQRVNLNLSAAKARTSVRQNNDAV